MSTQARCPQCGSVAPVPDGAVGRAARCKRCGTRFTIAPSTGASPPAPAAPPGVAVAATPVLVIGRYQVREKLGAGAFGTVYRAYDPQLDREVALKVLRPEALDSPQAVERFRREARAAAKMHHPHIVPVYDAGEHQGRHFIASAFIAGRTLASAIPEGGMDPRRAARLAAELAEALAYADKQGVLHRDIKPANALLDDRDTLYLADFGLAGWAQQAGSRLTQAGSVMGTPAYMAPEQAVGDTQRIGAAADQYSAGVVLYELLTGRVPFEGPMAAVVYHAVHTPPPPPSESRPDLDPALEAICLKAMAKKPEGRYPGCQDLAAALRDWLAAQAREPTEAPPAAGGRPARPTTGGERATGVSSGAGRETAVTPADAPTETRAAPSGGGGPGKQRSRSTPVVPGPRVAREGEGGPDRARSAGGALGGWTAWFLTAGALAVMAGGLVALLLAIRAAKRPQVAPPGVTSASLQQPPPTAEPPPIQEPPPAQDTPPAPAPAGLALLPLDDVAVQAGNRRTVTVRVKRQRCDGPVELRLEGLPAGIEQAGPALISADKDEGKVELTAAPGASKGSRTVHLRAVAAGVRAEGSFRINVEPRPPSPPVLDLSPLQDVAVQPGGRQSVTVRVKRQRCAGPVDLRLEGLPTGVTQAGPAQIPAGGDEGKVEVVAAPGAGKGGATVRLRAVAAGVRAEGRFRMTVEPPAVVEPVTLAKEVTNSIGMKLVLIPAGKFLMGSPPKDKARSSDEGQHEVEITRPFYLGVYLVTQEQYREVMGKNPSYFSPTGQGRLRVRGLDTSEFPVENVTWGDATGFCDKLSALPRERASGRLYRLPTEAEWEYACRGGARSSQPFHFGDSLSSTQANFNGNFPHGGADQGPFLRRTTKVGSYEANPFGLYDMHGTV